MTSTHIAVKLSDITGNFHTIRQVFSAIQNLETAGLVAMKEEHDGEPWWVLSGRGIAYINRLQSIDLDTRPAPDDVLRALRNP